MKTPSTSLLSLHVTQTVNNDHDLPVFLHRKRCTNSTQLKQIHAHMLQVGLHLDPYSASNLFAVSALSPFSSLDYASKVFDQIPKPNLTRGISSFGFMLQALNLSKEFDLLRMALHGMVIKASIGVDAYISNSLIHLYMSCGDLDSAYRVFMMVGEKMFVLEFDDHWFGTKGLCRKGVADVSKNGRKKCEANDVTMVGFYLPAQRSWTWSLGDGCILLRCKKLFGLMKEKDIVTWTTMLAGYAKLEAYEEARHILDTMPRQDVTAWNSLYLVMNRMGSQRKLCLYIMNCNRVKLLNLMRSLLLALYQLVSVRSIGSWRLYLCTVEDLFMIQGLAMHGQGKAAIDLEPCRAGLLEEAVEFIEKMPIPLWGALLGACQIHGNVELAERSCRCLLDLDPQKHGAYVLLSNIYAKTGKWDGVSRLRKHMRVTGLKKEQGCSRIEVNGVIHEFLAGDNCHPLSKEIYSKLDEIVVRLKSAGFVPNKSHQMQLIEEDDMQEHALGLHSEKLAIAFGLLYLEASQPIRIIKNLRQMILRDRIRYTRNSARYDYNHGKCDMIENATTTAIRISICKCQVMAATDPQKFQP
ncbi:hypothetical protein F3Y22_tig00116997pilonHSYRG00311 [Hibiscus syriacus]|uniref:DYW domain-containing protein n=1 Tax=Hibiscus syriacus TaxID=106335 RepID=A0A6A2WGA7_HIBSY|nr:hypothetical protein F3Y22_tig00116997pilonHSYRG00311 [Hibiscus syriacus]